MIEAAMLNARCPCNLIRRIEGERIILRRPGAWLNSRREASFRALKGRSKDQSVYLCCAYLPPSSLRRTEAVLPPPHGAERPYLDKSSPPQASSLDSVLNGRNLQLWNQYQDLCNTWSQLYFKRSTLGIHLKTGLGSKDIAASDKWPMSYFKTSNKVSFDFKAAQDLRFRSPAAHLTGRPFHIFNLIFSGTNRIDQLDVPPQSGCVDASLIGHSGKAQCPRVVRNSELRETLERTKYPARYSFVR
ncbi:hypothetical protein DFH09DRAFT_1086557 [Mycena vulgaris]|nr:hypothetical protein DFH09DRAFT_1086557 [Mycena vulgaris]